MESVLKIKDYTMKQTQDLFIRRFLFLELRVEENKSY